MATYEERDGSVSHDHEGLVHEHAHNHVTHNATGSGGFEHLSSTHEHEHDHAPLRHSHVAHQDFEREHQGEAHDHDHRTPVKKPRSATTRKPTAAKAGKT